MRARLKTMSAGPWGTFPPGFVLVAGQHMPAEKIKSLVQGGYAVVLGGAVESAVAAPAPENAAERTLPPWGMKTTPADYLERWPDGPKADLARAHLGD